MLLIYAANPDLLVDQDPELMKIMIQTDLKHFKKYSDLSSKRAFNWTVASTPVEDWTNKIFPDFPPINKKPKCGMLYLISVE